MSGAAKRIILIVRRDERELYARMSERYGEVAVVILDRRHSDRRLQRQPVKRDRRRRSRRQSWTAETLQHWHRLGYRLLYRAEGVRLDTTTNPPSD